MQLPPLPPTPPQSPQPPRPATPVAPAAPPATAVEAATQAAPGRPLTQAEIQSIRARRSELSNQLTSAEGRRNELAAQLEDAEGANRVGLEQRLAVLDKRIVQLESDIAETGRQLTSPQYTTTSAVAENNPFGMTSGQVTSVSIVFTLFVLAPMAIALARLLWRRATRGGPAADGGEVTRRLIGLEQSIEAIAVEVERVSEGQRYVTKLFTEGRGAAALGAGQPAAEPIRVGHAERVPLSGSER